MLILARNRWMLEPWARRLLDRAEPFIYGPAPSRCPVYRPKVITAIQSSQRLIAGKAIAADDLRVLLSFIPSKRTDLLQRGVKAICKRHTGAVTRELLAGEWGCSGLLRLLDEKGPLALLISLPDVERVYVRRVLERFEFIPERPRWSLSTIHGAKGREANTVLVIPNMLRASYDELIGVQGNAGTEAERRVAYVAVTRARHRLILVEPRGRKYFPYQRYLNQAMSWQAPQLPRVDERNV